MAEKKNQRIVAAMMGLAMLAVTTSIGADELPKILPLKPVPDIQLPKATASGNIEFSGKGTIQRVGKDEVQKKIIVIDDRLMYFASDAKYYDVKGKPTSPIFFHKGRRVGYIFNDNRHITALFLIAD